MDETVDELIDILMDAGWEMDDAIEEAVSRFWNVPVLTDDPE